MFFQSPSSFFQKSSGWECPTCMIVSPKSLLKCPACQTEQPKSGPPKTETKTRYVRTPNWSLHIGKDIIYSEPDIWVKIYFIQ